MSKLAGLVAILDEEGAVVGYRDLGDTPVEVKPGRALPVDDLKPGVASDERYTAPVVEIVNGRVKRTWSVEKIPPEPPSLEERISALEDAVFKRAVK